MLRDWSSLPSDTAGIIFALVTGIFLASRPLGLVSLAYALIGPIFGKLVAGHHYLSDVLAEAMTGVASTTCLYLLLTRTNLFSKITSPLRLLNPVMASFLSFMLIFHLATFFEDARRAKRTLLTEQPSSAAASVEARGTPAAGPR